MWQCWTWTYCTVFSSYSWFDLCETTKPPPPPPRGGAKLKHTVFSQLNAPGIYFKLDLMDPAFIRSRRLIGARRLLMRCFFFCHGKLIYYHPTSKNQQSWSSRDDFSFVLCDKLSLGLLLVTHHTIQYAYYSWYMHTTVCMLQSRCVKKKSDVLILNAVSGMGNCTQDKCFKCQFEKMEVLQFFSPLNQVCSFGIVVWDSKLLRHGNWGELGPF